MITKHKAFAYITKGSRLLVFEQPEFPKAGIQVPAGTIEPGEEPEQAALREALEETGLIQIRLESFLGLIERDMSDYGVDEIHQRYFYHLRCDQELPDDWSHDEQTPSSGRQHPIVFNFYWVQIPDGLPDLIADHGQLVPTLLTRL